MNFRMMIVAVAMAPCMASATTKRLECTQTTDKGVEQMVFATIDDTSDKAEVESYALSADCAKDRSCGTKVYSKDVLPSVIRLINVMRAGSSASYTTTIDIDRSTLAIVSRTSLSTSVGDSETLARGQCTMNVDAAKKVL